MNNSYQVIVIGGGHAGTEAALAAARLGAQTLLLTHNIDTIGQMSCNPSIGGIGKSHLVKEIDAMGGAMALCTDQAGIHFRTLNASKGPAVRATRAQTDRTLYKRAVREAVEQQPNLSYFQQPVDDFILEGDTIKGVKTQAGLEFFADTVILTAGTFLGGKIHIGTENSQGGRAGDPPSNALAQRLRERPFRVGRLKTGTPPRLDGRTINFDALTIQPGEDDRPVFSVWGSADMHPAQRPCYIAKTNETTHEVIRSGLSRSPMYTGKFEGVGPRYCPSIEDKIVRFSEKLSHQIFIEPEGLFTHEVYPSGLFTSLPFDIQVAMVRTMEGLEKTHLTRPGYAIEYDYFDPRDLHPWLESKVIDQLFLAGQINGTTGYEEAAAQGLLAGINAGLRALGREPWYPRRDQAYLGVLVDDLITCGTQEPYRMFTSRAEYRLLLREDNADQRLTPKARELGLISDQQWAQFEEKQSRIEKAQAALKTLWIRPGDLAAKDFETQFGKPLSREYRASELMQRPEVDYQNLMQVLKAEGETRRDVIQQIDIQAKYAGYLERQAEEIALQQRHENTTLPASLDYSEIPSLSTEVAEKLSTVRPTTIGMAQRIPGVTPAAISLLLVYIKRKTQKETTA